MEVGGPDIWWGLMLKTYFLYLYVFKMTHEWKLWDSQSSCGKAAHTFEFIQSSENWEFGSNL